VAIDFESKGGRISGRNVLYRHGSQYDEYRDLLFRRVRILFLLAAGISAILIAVSRLMDHPGNPYMRSSQELMLDAAHVLSFVIGLVLLYLLRDDARRMQWLAFGTLAFNALIGSVSTGGLFVPDYPPELVAALLLFVPAAVIPWRTPFQLGLASVTVAAFLFSPLAIYTLDPASHETFATLDAFVLRFAMFATGVSTFAATSVFMTHTLYTLRKTAAEARRLGSYMIEREIVLHGLVPGHPLGWLARVG
jgi:hypothetical protein